MQEKCKCEKTLAASSGCKMLIVMVHRVGLEPTTKRLRVSCSTIELAMLHGGTELDFRRRFDGRFPSCRKKSERDGDTTQTRGKRGAE